MGQIFIFTDNYRDLIVQRLPDAQPCRFGGLHCLAIADGHDAVSRLAQIALAIMDNDANCKQSIENKFVDFLSENKYIHIDAFIRVCL